MIAAGSGTRIVIARARRRAGGRGGAGGAEMIAAGSGTRIVIARRPVDFRKQADSLAALVAADLAQDPYSGTIYVFRSKRRDRIKLVGFDGSGLWLFAKRLETGRFEWPEIADGVMTMSAAQLAALLDGVDWRRVAMPNMRRPSAVR